MSSVSSDSESEDSKEMTGGFLVDLLVANVFQSVKKNSQNGTNKSFAKQSVKTCDHNVFTAKKYSEIQWADAFQSANQQNNERGKRNETMHMFQSAKITVKTVSTKVS